MLLKYFLRKTNALIKYVLVIPVLLLQFCLWFSLLAVLLPVSIAFYVYKLYKGNLSFNSKSFSLASKIIMVDQRNVELNQDEIVFNRIHDVSKVIGCNTRNVQYRWDIFTHGLEKLRTLFPAPLKVLDFGAGSLCDTFYMSTMGDKVDAVDINKPQLLSSFRNYDWSKIKYPPNLSGAEILILHENIDRYNLILAFDVIEHLLNVDEILAKLKTCLTSNGQIFVTVPNRCTLIEKYHKSTFKHRLKKDGTIGNSGIPHVNFKTTKEWVRFFHQKGFRIIDHDMAIGFFVNDLFFGLNLVIIQMFFWPILMRFSSIFSGRWSTQKFEKLFYPKWLMKYVNELDESTKTYIKQRWGWNLFVLGHLNM